jgi:hypothetical protein
MAFARNAKEGSWREGNLWRPLKRTMLRLVRDALWRADEWIQREEAKLQDAAIARREIAVVDPAASRLREQAQSRERRAASPRTVSVLSGADLRAFREQFLFSDGHWNPTKRARPEGQ